MKSRFTDGSACGRAWVDERKMGREQFTYRITKDGRLFVYWHGKGGKREIVLKGRQVRRLIADLPGMEPEQEQSALARSTGNFKRGNERPSR